MADSMFQITTGTHQAANMSAGNPASRHQQTATPSHRVDKVWVLLEICETAVYAESVGNFKTVYNPLAAILAAAE